MIAVIGLPGSKWHRWQRCKTRREALAWAEVERRNVPSGERFYTLTDREGRASRYQDGRPVYREHVDHAVHTFEEGSK